MRSFTYTLAHYLLSPLSLSQVFNSLSQLMEQCWHHDGEARVTALRVKKNLSNLQTMKCSSKKDQSVAAVVVNNRNS